MNKANERAKKDRLKLIDSFGGKCKVCGSEGNLQFAHVKETGLNGMGRGRKERVYDVSKNRGSYLLLCCNCHRDFDAGRIKIEGYAPPS